MSTKAQAILEEIQGLPPAELRELFQQINRMVAQLPSFAARVPDAEFDAALDEVTGCTAGSNGLQRLLDDRQHERQRDEAFLGARLRKHARG